MTKRPVLLAGLLVALLPLAAARAQVTVDVAKITCKQFRGYEVANPNSIAIWLSGYFNGKRGNTVIEIEAFKDDVEKVKDFCISNPDTTVMQAVETLLSKK